MASLFMTPTDDQRLIEAYRRLRSVAAAGREFGLTPQAAHVRLRRAGVTCDLGWRKWSEADSERLRLDYMTFRSAGTVKELAREMGRTVPFLSRMAARLGITNGYPSEKVYLRTWKGITEEAAWEWFEKFRSSRLTVRQFAMKNGIDDLGFSRELRRHFPAEWEALVELKAPKQTLYRLGRSLEYRVRDALKLKGFFVTRSPQSRSPVDLTAIRHGLVLFVQCKRGGELGITGWNELFDLAQSVGAVPVLAAAVTGTGIQYWRLTDRKDGTRRRQPMVPYEVPAR